LITRHSLFTALILLLLAAGGLPAAEIIPALGEIKQDRPRLLIRPAETPLAVSLGQLRSQTSHSEYEAMLAKLRQERNAACQALVWQMTGDSSAADTAVAMLKRYRYAPAGDTFDVFGTLFEYGLAYDWVHDYPRFSTMDRGLVRYYLNQFARTDGLRYSGDHIFHNYIWMSACGTTLWALAVAGEDTQSDSLFNDVRAWLNDRLYPGMEYLDGLPTESLGYWSLYDFTSAAWTVLAAQSAFEQDLVGRIAGQHGDWLRRHYLNEIHSVLPDMRFIPWGDVIGGPNGSVTHEMAGVLDALAWAYSSGPGVYFSNWLAGKRGTARFYGWTAPFYMIYTKHLTTPPETPPLSYLAGGGTQGGHFIARSGWDAGATVVSFGVKDHYGDHNHYDQGGFTVFRNGLLATDPTVYSQVNGPQQPSGVHSTLVINGAGQDSTRHGQSHGTLESFLANLHTGQRLDTGDFLSYAEGGEWAAAAGQYAQAYRPGLVESCVRQVLFIRPATLVVVDQLAAPAASSLEQVEWLVQLSGQPQLVGSVATVSNGKSWLRCVPLTGEQVIPVVQATSVNTWRTRYRYSASSALVLVHRLDTGDGDLPDSLPAMEVAVSDSAVELSTGRWTYTFSRSGDYKVTARRQNPGDVNADDRVDVFDLLALLKQLAGRDAKNEYGDVDGNGRVDIFDLLRLLKLMIGI